MISCLPMPREPRRAAAPDPLTPAQRRRCMSAIKAKDTKPELILRRGLHARGFRYRLHARELPGTPDIVLPRHKAVIFVQGCFWHGHDCHLFKLPASRPEFWAEKIRRNRERDAAAISILTSAGWRALNAWECTMRGRTRMDSGELLQAVSDWIISDDAVAELPDRSRQSQAAG